MTFPNQERIRVIGKARTVYRDPACQWQGMSSAECGGSLRVYTVAAEFPVHFEREVVTCERHAPTFVQVASKRGQLQ